MTSKKLKQRLTLAGIITAAALSMTFKLEHNIPKDTVYATMGKPVDIPLSENASIIPYYRDILDNTIDTLESRRADYETLDSLINKAKSITPFLKIPLIYTSEHLNSLEASTLRSLVSSAVNRPMINAEALVNTILDTINTYTEVVDKYFIKASIREESWYNPKIKSHAGAIGLMQFTKSAWKRFGEGSYLPNVYNPEKNIRAGIRYYTWMEEEFSKRHPKWDTLTNQEKQGFLAAGYNGGPYRLMDKKFKVNWNMEKMPKESIEHIAKINNAIEEFHLEELYLNIAQYQTKIARYVSEKDSMSWLAYDAARTGIFMRNNILFSNNIMRYAIKSPKKTFS